jgi:hypothetical protein
MSNLKNLSLIEKHLRDEILFLTKIEAEGFDFLPSHNASENDIYAILSRKTWFNKCVLSKTTNNQAQWNLLENHFFDISINNRLYLFSSEYGVDSWQASIIISALCLLNDISCINDEILLKSIMPEMQTNIIARFFTIFNAETSFQTIKLPSQFSCMVLNDRFRDKFMGGGEYLEADYKSFRAIYGVLTNAIDLSRKTNEGKKIRFNSLFFMDEPSNSVNSIMHISGLQNHKFTNSFCQSYDSFFLIDSGGYIFSYDTINNDRIDHAMNIFSTTNRTPFLFKDVVNALEGYSIQKTGNGVLGIILEEDGSIFLLFLTGIVAYYKNGLWNFNIYKGFVKNVGINPELGLIESIYDLLVKNTGACIGIFYDNNPSFSLKRKSSDLGKFGFIGKRFIDIPQEIRYELLSIDGAVLLDGHSGVINSVAQILPVSSSEDMGGRTEAAKYIAQNNGIGIKVSEDGYIDIYVKGKEHGVVECAISFGKKL